MLGHPVLTREAKSQRARFCSRKKAIISLHMIDSPSPIQVILEASGLKCPVCNTAGWKASKESVACQSCASSYLFDDGVLRIDGGPKDSTTRFYAAFGGTHFLDTSFANNPVIHCTSRRYRRFIAEQFPSTTGSLLDFGCGDGRLSLWAAENGFSPVIAIDTNLASLKRLAAEARHRSLFNLLVICCDVIQPPFVKDHFDAVLCFEVLYYLVLRFCAGSNRQNLSTRSTKRPSKQRTASKWSLTKGGWVQRRSNYQEVEKATMTRLSQPAFSGLRGWYRWRSLERIVGRRPQ